MKITAGASLAGFWLECLLHGDLPNLIFQGKYIVYFVYCTDDDAVSGYASWQLSGVDKIGLLDSLLGIIFRQFFSTFPIFIMYRFSKGFSGVLEGARLDCAGELKLFFIVAIP